MNRYNIVTNSKICQSLKSKSKYFKTSLGIVNTIDKNGDRVYNDRDKFAYFYNTEYKTTIHAAGNIGDIMFYVDHYINEDVLAVYLNSEEFIFQLDQKLLEEKGPDFYIGHVLKELETKYEERVREAELKKLEVKRESNPDILTQNPGAVRYDDIKAYIEKKRNERMSVQEVSDKKEV